MAIGKKKQNFPEIVHYSRYLPMLKPGQEEGKYDPLTALAKQFVAIVGFNV
jgi:hypothetical protein